MVKATFYYFSRLIFSNRSLYDVAFYYRLIAEEFNFYRALIYDYVNTSNERLKLGFLFICNRELQKEVAETKHVAFSLFSLFVFMSYKTKL